MLRVCCVIGVLALAIGMCGPANAQAAKCAAEVKKLQASPELRIQGGQKNQVTTRASAIVYLQSAAQAAQENNEKLCWEKLREAQTAMLM
jgi:hypothetical protein